jgi:anthranilate 1,2-dioxygenase small subunit
MNGTPTLATDYAHVPAAITALMAEYVHVIDSDRIEDWPGLFTDPCLYKIVTRDNHRRALPAAIMSCDSRGMMLDRIASVRQANVFEPHSYRHFVSSIRMLGADDNIYRMQCNYLVVRVMRSGTFDVFSTGEYLDRIVVNNGIARFGERIVVCDHSVIRHLIAVPL